MADEINIGTNVAKCKCVEKAKLEKAMDGHSPVTFIDCGEELAEELQIVKEELHKQVLSAAHKVDILWEVVRCCIVFIIPVVSCLCLSFLSQFYLPGWISVVLTTIFIGIAAGLVFLNITPLNEAIMAFGEFRLYRPKFPGCLCTSCGNLNNCSEINNKQMSTDNPREITTQHPDSPTKIQSKPVTPTRMLLNDSFRRRSKEWNTSDDNIFRETTSYLESSIHHPADDFVDDIEEIKLADID